jgi:hypothetical protein
MSLRTYKIISSAVSVAIGLLAAFTFVGGARTFLLPVSAEASSSVGAPYTPIVIRFSVDLAEAASIGDVSVAPEHPFRSEWRDRRTLALIPEDRWEPGIRYRVSAPGGKDGVFRDVLPISFAFSVPGYPEIVSFSPETGAQDILLDIEDPITVSFDRSAGDFYVDFRLSPDIRVVYENDHDKTAFRILPQEALMSDTEYVLSVYAKWKGEPDDTFRFLGETRFRTIAPEPDTWESDLALRTEQALRYAYATIPVGKYIDIHLENQIMTLFQDGKAIDAYPISSGKPGMETPAGTYAIRNKAARPWSARYGLYMPYWMALVPDGKFGIHELPEWPGGYKEGANHLGIPVSHGCVRLGVGPAGLVYDWAEIGTPVIVR